MGRDLFCHVFTAAGVANGFILCSKNENFTGLAAILAFKLKKGHSYFLMFNEKFW
jgi:hypothetical protein